MLQKLFSFSYKAIHKIIDTIFNVFNQFYCHILFYGQNINYKNFKTSGLPYVSIAKNGGKCVIGDQFKMNNGLKGNPIGRPQKCVLFVGENAHLTIGNNVGISQTAIVCHDNITIGDYVKIGGGVCIYDTDFHSLNSSIRKDSNQDISKKINKPVVIKNNAFIGAHSTILKGVVIGENSVVGACSLVVKSIPDNEIWAGNPAKFIKKTI